MKRKLSLILAIIMLVSLLAMPKMAFAAEGGTELGKLTGVEATLYNSTSIRVNWDVLEGASGYIIYEMNDEGEYEALKYVKDGDKDTVVIKNLEKGKTYDLAIKAYSDLTGERVNSEFEYTSVKLPKLLTKDSEGFEDTTAAKILELAETKLGCRYVRGAEGPNAFDCSGYTYWVMKNSKASTKSFSRSSAAGNYSSLREYSIGTRDLSEAQPGDMVYFNPGGGRITHVAFYYGDGKLIHATNPRDGVRVTPAKWFGRVAGIVRLPNL